MIKCDKCNVEVDAPISTCPLCGSKIPKNPNSTYPIIKNSNTWKFVKRLLFLIICSLSVLIVFLNYTLTPNIKWGIFTVAGLFSMYVIFLGIVNGRKRILSMMFYLCFIILLITVFWDYLVGYRGWSLNYVLPSLSICYGIFLIILRFVSYLAFTQNSTYIYLHVLLEFLPLVLYYTGVVTFKPLAIISAIFGITNLSILVIFDTSNFKNDLARKLHI